MVGKSHQRKMHMSLATEDEVELTTTSSAGNREQASPSSSVEGSLTTKKISRAGSSDDDLVPLVKEFDGDFGEEGDHSHHSPKEDHHGVGPPGSATTPQMVINIIISFVGAGLLGQPHAFMEAGWLLGGVALLSISALNVYAMLLLPTVQNHLNRTYPNESVNSYSDIASVLLGSLGERVVIACLAISQAGFATAYIIFIAANVSSIVDIPRFVICYACVPGLVGLVQFQDLKSLSPFSLLANVSNFCALSAVLVQDYEKYEPHNDTIHPVKWEGLLGVIAVTIYSMEGVGMILSLKGSSKQPQQFPWLLSVTLAIISVFMVFFGAAGYISFGNNTQAPITLNLASHWSATFVKLALCLGLYLTYPIMMFPIWNILEAPGTRLANDRVGRIVARSGVVVVSATIAYVMPNFGKFLRLVGSSICTLLGFIFPTMFHVLVRGNEMSMAQYSFDIFILIGGSLFGLLGTYQSVVAMLEGEDIGE